MNDSISRQAAIETVRKAKSIGQAHRMLVQLPSTQPDVPDTNVGDMISRQATIAEIMEDLEDRSLHDDPATPEDYAEGYDEGIRNAAAIVLQMPSAQPSVSKTETVEDCISRAVAIDAFLTELTKRERKNFLHTWSTVEVKYFVADMLEKLPSAQPEIIRCKDCKHNPKYEWFGCPMSHLSEAQRPETAWCWKAERRTDE